jgi:hypothetical protein
MQAMTRRQRNRIKRIKVRSIAKRKKNEDCRACKNRQANNFLIRNGE